MLNLTTKSIVSALNQASSIWTPACLSSRVEFAVWAVVNSLHRGEKDGLSIIMGFCPGTEYAEEAAYILETLPSEEERVEARYRELLAMAERNLQQAEGSQIWPAHRRAHDYVGLMQEAIEDCTRR